MRAGDKAFMIVLLSVVTVGRFAIAQPPTPSQPLLDWGSEGLEFPPIVMINGHTPRTAQLLGAAYSNEKLVWKRAQYTAELGLAAQQAGAVYLAEAMTDPSPLVRSEAARAAAMINDASLLPEVESLLRDESAQVRREAVLAAARLARAHNNPSTAIDRGLDDAQAQVVAAALEAAWAPRHAPEIARRVASLPDELKADAALALGRLKAVDQAAAILPLLKGNVLQRSAAVRALGAMGSSAHVDSLLSMLKDPHPTVRREAIAAFAQAADAAPRQARAMEMLGDSDLTVREAAARVLTPAPSPDTLAPLAAQLEQPYAPLHDAAREALVHPANQQVQTAVSALASEMLTHVNPRRREDASYILGRLRSDSSFDQHVELLQWNSEDLSATDWLVVAQAAESAGLILDQRAVEPLMTLVQPAPDVVADAPAQQRNHMSLAMTNALVALARLQHKPALDEAVRIIQLDPQGISPTSLRAAAAFAIGALGEPGQVPRGVSLLQIYDSVYEGRQTKFEALKALGNLRHKPSAAGLLRVAESSPAPDMRWIAHWAYEQTSEKRVPYTPPSQLDVAPVSVSDLAR